MPPAKFQEEALVRRNQNYRGDYYLLELTAPQIAAATRPGQFLHLLVPNQPQLTLRRPFSIYNADPASGLVAIVYKDVGIGTHALAQVPAGTAVSLLGPLGNGFAPPPAGLRPVIVAGGYGCAATYLLAKRAVQPGIVLLGGRSAPDILLHEEFAATGSDVRLSTNDGSLGHRGLVTELLPDALAADPAAVYACGPNPMLKAVARLCLERGLDAALSVDKNMGCGVGACFACVVKLKANNPDGWEYVRSCKDGPVFLASQLVLDALD